MLTLLLALLSDPALAADVRLAVLEFQDASSDADHSALGKGLQSMLTTDLSKVPDAEMVERARLQEILDELELGESGKVDPATAAKIGKLSGATHLVDGSFTVVGATMRLDARLVEVESGEVVVGEAVEGERDAFFELEKDLVKVFVKGIGVELAPKDRAAIGRLHTADFEAFSEFSKGIALFDADRYDDAVAAMDRAIVRDGEFTLAKLTQQQYAEIIQRLDTKTDAMRVAKEEARLLEKAQKASAELGMVQRLTELANTPGDEALVDRLTALALLATLYDNGQNKLGEFGMTLDRYQRRRLGEHYAQRYVTESRECFPDCLYWPTGGYLKPDQFDRYFGEHRERVWGKEGADAERRRKYVLNNLDGLTSNWSAMERYHVDYAGYVALMQEARELGVEELDGDADWRHSFDRSIAHRMVAAGRFDEATRVYAKLAETESNSKWIDNYKRSIELAKEAERIIGAARDPDRVREYYVLRAMHRSNAGFWRMQPDEFAEAHLSGAEPTAFGRQVMQKIRNLMWSTERDLIFLSDVPLWPLKGRDNWTTGPRTNGLRTESLAYYRSDDRGKLQPRSPTWSLALMGGQPRAELTASFTLDPEPDEHFWPLQVWPDNDEQTWRDVKLDGDKPSFGFVFGARDWQVPKARDLDRPFLGWMVQITADTVSLQKVGSMPTSIDQVFETQELDSKDRKDKGGSAQVDVALTSAGALTVHVAGKKYSFTVPDYEAGHVGLFVDGDGYVRVQDLELGP